MTLSRASWYAILAVIEVGAQNKADPDSPVLARDIAAATKVPPEYLAKLLTQLVKARILTSGRGPTGGYFLATAPGEVALLDVVEVVDGQLDAGFPPRTRGATPTLHKKVGDVLQKSIEAMRSELAGQKLPKFL